MTTATRLDLLPFRARSPGAKHDVWLVRDGVVLRHDVVELERGGSLRLAGDARSNDFAVLEVTGPNVKGAVVTVDGVPVCDDAPCRLILRGGRRRIEMKKYGYQTFARGESLVTTTLNRPEVTLEPER